MNKSKFILSLFLLLVLILTCTKGVNAQDFDWIKNKFGIHILNSTSEIFKAKELLQKDGGEWSWLTIVIRSDELNKKQWQEFFDVCRQEHFIPLVRISTKVENGNWQSPTETEVNRMATFLDELNWPTKDKFIILYNEPNRSDEWGGKADPAGYAKIIKYASELFKKKDENFHILSGGLDLAAPNSPSNFYSAERFYQEMLSSEPEVFSNIDGIASHSYPNHGFIGSPYDQGKTSIRGYEWELDYLKSLGVEKNLFVFITETGWPHQEGQSIYSKYFTCDALADKYKTAFEIWNNDDRVKAFTPFLLSYQFEPFDHFSWTKPDGSFYSHAFVLGEKKENNNPDQTNKAEVLEIDFPYFLVPENKYRGKLLLKNTGQKIWGEKERFCFPGKEISGVEITGLCQSENKLINPQESAWFDFEFLFTENQDQISFGWENLPELELKPLISKKTHIYKSEVSLVQKISQSWYNRMQTLSRLITKHLRP